MSGYENRPMMVEEDAEIIQVARMYDAAYRQLQMLQQEQRKIEESIKQAYGQMRECAEQLRVMTEEKAPASRGFAPPHAWEKPGAG